MKNLIDELRELGLTEEQVRKSIDVVFDWVDERYPVLAALARPMIKNELARSASEKTF